MTNKDFTLGVDGVVSTMTVRDFIYKTKTPLIQRDHEARVKSGKVSYFSKPLPNHLVVFIAEYTGKTQAMSDGDNMQPGDLFVMDGNTRKHFWKIHLETLGASWEEFSNTHLITVTRKMSSFEELNAWYDTFDSKGQLKTPKDNAKSAANLLGLEDHMIKNMSTAVSKCVRLTKPEGMTEVDFVAKKVEMFGVEIIREFYETFGNIIPPKAKNKISPFLVAYKKLSEDFPEKSFNINVIFTEMFTNNYSNALDKNGNKFVAYELHDLFLQDGVYSYLNPKSSGDRIPIIAGVVYSVVKRAVCSNKYYVPSRNLFAQSTAGAKRAMEIFYEEIAEKVR